MFCRCHLESNTDVSQDSVSLKGLFLCLVPLPVLGQLIFLTQALITQLDAPCMSLCDSPTITGTDYVAD